MKKVLWFSRHTMTSTQTEELKQAFGPIESKQIDGTMLNVHVPFNGLPPFKEQVKGYDIIAVVMPINLLQQAKGVIGDRPLLTALNKRVENGQNEAGETQYTFVHQKWEVIDEIKIVKHDLLP